MEPRPIPAPRPRGRNIGGRRRLAPARDRHGGAVIDPHGGEAIDHEAGVDRAPGGEHGGAGEGGDHEAPGGGGDAVGDKPEVYAGGIVERKASSAHRYAH